MSASRRGENFQRGNSRFRNITVSDIFKWKSNQDSFKEWIRDESDFVKYLYADEVSVDCKLALLTHFQEVALVFLTSLERLEETVWSLSGLYSNFQHKDGAPLRSQLLTTITSILLTCDGLVDKDGLLELLEKHIQQLVNILSKPKKEALLVKIAASQSLEEIETFTPCCLQPHLEVIWLSCQQETSAAFQFYLCLLSLTVKNIMCQHEATVLKSSGRSILQHQQSEVDPLPVAVYCLDSLPSLSPMSVDIVLRYLLNVVRSNVSQPIHVFKMWFPRLCATYFVPWLHTALAVQEILLDQQTKRIIFGHLVQLQKHPSLSTAQRLLALEWIEDCREKAAGVHICKELTPSPFDGYDTRSKKIKILALRQELPLTLLLKCLEGLFKGVKEGGRPAVVFFQTLYSYFSVVSSQVLVAHSNRFFLHLVDLAPTSLDHLLDFVSCIRERLPECSVAEEILGNVLGHVLEISSDRCFEKLDYYLKFLRRVSDESPAVFRPKDTLKFLQKLLNLKNVSYDWTLGHDLLTTVFCILQNQDIRLIYAELGDILYKLMTHSEDIDIRSRAKLYYAAMMSMTPEKVKELFDMARKMDNEQETCLEPGRSVFSLVAPIQLLQEQILIVSRVSSNYSSDISVFWQDELGADNISKYRECTDFEKSLKTLRVTFVLKIEESCENKFNRLFGIILWIYSNAASCNVTPKIVIPVLLHQKDILFNVDVSPVTIQPFLLNVVAEFSTAPDETYSCHLRPLLIRLQDLFLPLPVPSEKRSWLFEALWEELLKTGHHTITTYSVPLEELAVKWNHCQIGEDKVGIFVPPSSHLLLRVSQRNCLLVATDTLSILPWLNNVVFGLDDEDAVSS